MSYNYYVLATTTIVGGVLQLTFRRYEKFSPKLETQGKKSKRKAISKFLAKNGLIAGVGIGVTTIFFKEGLNKIQIFSKKIPSSLDPKFIFRFKFAY